MSRSLILSTVVRLVAPLLFLFAAVLYLGGHNAPGGGFIAGLLTSAAVLLRFIAFGGSRAARRMPWLILLVPAGLFIALATAVTPALLGFAFFTHSFTIVHLPILGEVELASAALFDLGVYLVVVGNVVNVIMAMTERD